jgi:uncharacterized membrane protein YesL
MKKNKEFQNRTIYSVLNYFYWFLMGNLYFALLNIPLLYLLFVSSPPRSAKLSMLEIFICCLPIGSAFTALLGAMGKIVREKDINITKDFFRMYKTNFKQATLLWAVELALILILFIDIASASKVFLLLFVILLVVVSLTGLYMFSIISRFDMKSKDVVIISIHCLTKQIKVTLWIILSLTGGIIVFYMIPGISILFIVSFMCYCIAYYQKDLLKTLENKVGF